MNPQAMNKNTGDGELEELRAKIVEELKDADSKGTGYVSNRIMALITSDKQQLLKELMEYEITLFNSKDKQH